MSGRIVTISTLKKFPKLFKICNKCKSINYYSNTKCIKSSCGSWSPLSDYNTNFIANKIDVLFKNSLTPDKTYIKV